MLDYYLFKKAYDLFSKGKAHEGKQILNELQEKYIEICHESKLLKTQIQEYEDILYLAKNLIYDGTCYWLMTGTVRQGPFCRNCYDDKGLLVRLNEDPAGWRCYTCGMSYHQEKDAGRSEEAAISEKMENQKVIQLYK